MKASKKALAILMAALMMMALMVPALASGSGTTTTATEKAIQITKTLQVGQGIAIPNETFTFQFKNADYDDVDTILREANSGIYLDPRPNTTQTQVTYPTLPDMSVTYSSASRSDSESTDTEVTYMAAIPSNHPAVASDGMSLDLSKITWPRPGLYIYEVTEVVPANGTDGMTYDSQKYFLKVDVQHDSTANTNYVNAFYVMGYDGSTWNKINPAPTSDKEITNIEDRCDDYKGNTFHFINVYKELVKKHPVDAAANDTPISGDAEHSDNAFQLTKTVAGSYASNSVNDAFDFDVKVILPATCDPATDLKDENRPVVYVNGYSAHKIDQTLAITDETAMTPVNMPLDGSKMEISLRATQQFYITQLPKGSIVMVTEHPIPGMAYAPSYLGQWGVNPTSYTDSAEKETSLSTRDIVVGDHGAYVHYTNTINENDISVTGIVINNLPYILMIVIAVAGIGFYMVSRKRRA